MPETDKSENQVCILLTVWGEEYINDFLKLSMRSLLAPGNIPALTKKYKTKFIFLTRAYQQKFFTTHPAFEKLLSYCEVEFLPIDHFIVIGNYSTTVTLAYDYAIKTTGEAMLKTYFIFLVSDYIMADGSFEGLMRYMDKGYSGICAGNFQVIKEEVEEYFLRQVDYESQTLQIKPRELLKKSFNHLHSIVAASFYAQNVVHNYYVNRFYHQYDEQVIAGRFYLLHMLCIKPERMDYQVGSSCDYSFIPEMCPSGNVAVIQDSDDYLVVEIQNKNHELGYIGWGKYQTSRLIHALTQWTTVQHRQNATQSIYFHARDLKAEDKLLIEAELNQFIEPLNKSLQGYKPKPHYNHPYWIGAVEAFDKQKALIKGYNDCEYYDSLLLSSDTFWKRLCLKIFGDPPAVFPWHHRWREYQLMTKEIRKLVNEDNCKDTIVLYDSYQKDFMRYCKWLKDSVDVPNHFYLRSLANESNKLTQLQEKKFSLAIVFVRIDDLNEVSASLVMVRALLKQHGKLLMIISNERNRCARYVYDFQAECAYRISSVINARYRVDGVKTINNNLSMIGAIAIHRLNVRFAHNKKYRFLSYIICSVPAMIYCFIRNCFPRLWIPYSDHCTNVLMTASIIEER